MEDLSSGVCHKDISNFLPLQTTKTTTNLPPTNNMKTLLVIAVAVVAVALVEAAPTPGHHSHHGHRDKHPEEHVCTEVDIQEIFEDGELIDIIEKIIPVACPEHGRHRPSHHNHHYHHDEDSSEEDSDEDK